MEYLCAALSAGVGAVQILLLSAVTLRITGIKSGKILPFLLVKLGLYGIVIAASLLCFREYVLYVGIGFAVGFLITLIITTLLRK